MGDPRGLVIVAKAFSAGFLFLFSSAFRSVLSTHDFQSIFQSLIIAIRAHLHFTTTASLHLPHSVLAI